MLSCSKDHLEFQFIQMFQMPLCLKKEVSTEKTQQLLLVHQG